MGTLSLLQSFLGQNAGVARGAGSTGGPLNSKLAMLVPYVNGTTGLVLAFPSTNGPVVSCSTAAANTLSAYTTILSSGTLSSHMLTGMHLRLQNISTSVGGSGIQWEVYFDVASGAAGAEVVQYLGHAGGTNGSSTTPQVTHIQPLSVFPPVPWPTNERVSFRMSATVTSIVSGSAVATFATRPA